MVVVRFWRGLRSIGFRGLSTHGSPEAPSIEPTKKILKSASDPKCCYILGSRGIKQFSVELFIPLAEFLKREPVFTKVPSDRLIAHVDVKKPYLTSEAGRVWIRSGYILPHLCHLQSLSLLNPFTEGNVGILDGFGILCFRELHLLENFVPDTEDSSLSPVNTVTNSCFTSFLKDMLVEEYNTWSVAPDGLCALMKAADAPLDKEIIYNPELMPDELQATLFQDMQRLVRKQLPTRGLHSRAMGIMQHVHNRLTV